MFKILFALNYQCITPNPDFFQDSICRLLEAAACLVVSLPVLMVSLFSLIFFLNVMVLQFAR